MSAPVESLPVVLRPKRVVKRRVSVGLAIAIALWGGTALGGMGWLLAYKQTGGPAAVAPSRFPTELSFARTPEFHTLVMVVHPKCSCSGASVGELAKLMTRLKGRIEAHILFVRPEGVEGVWEETEKTGLYKTAALIEGIDLRIDRGGVDAARLGAFTSGQTYLYGPDGNLLFSGGITQSRGHHGDSLGSAQIEAILMRRAKGRADMPTTDVYGCELANPTRLASDSLL